MCTPQYQSHSTYVPCGIRGVISYITYHYWYLIIKLNSTSSSRHLLYTSGVVLIGAANLWPSFDWAGGSKASLLWRNKCKVYSKCLVEHIPALIFLQMHPKLSSVLCHYEHTNNVTLYARIQHNRLCNQTTSMEYNYKLTRYMHKSAKGSEVMMNEVSQLIKATGFQQMPTTVNRLSRNWSTGVFLQYRARGIYTSILNDIRH